jgi:competence protein ComGC
MDSLNRHRVLTLVVVLIVVLLVLPFVLLLLPGTTTAH